MGESKMTSVGEEVEQPELTYTAVGNGHGCNHFIKLPGSIY